MYTNRWLLANGILMTQKWSHTRLWCWSWKSDCTIQSHTMIWIHDRKGRYTRNQRHDFAKFTQFRLIPQSWLDPFTHIDLCGNIKWLSNSSYQQLWLNMRYTFLPHQMTENFIVVPETSYMYDPCVRCDLLNNHLTHFTEETMIRWDGNRLWSDGVPWHISLNALWPDGLETQSWQGGNKSTNMRMKWRASSLWWTKPTAQIYTM